MIFSVDNRLNNFSQNKNQYLTNDVINYDSKEAMMKAVITKPMCVVGDNKSTVRFEPSTPNNPFVEVSNQVYARLKRANAVKPFVDVQTKIKPDKTIEHIKQVEKEPNQILSETVTEETSLEKPKESKASKPLTPTPKKA